MAVVVLLVFALRSCLWRFCPVATMVSRSRHHQWL